MTCSLLHTTLMIGHLFSVALRCIHMVIHEVQLFDDSLECSTVCEWGGSQLVSRMVPACQQTKTTQRKG